MILLVLSFSGVASAADSSLPTKGVPAKDVLVSTPEYSADPEYQPSLGIYEYRVSWQGIGAARVKVYVDKVSDDYHITATARTNKYIDVFYKLRYRAAGVISASDMSPRKIEIDQRENSRIKRAKVEFKPDGLIHAVRWKKGQQVADETFDPQNFTLEPFSAGFLARR